MAYADLRGIVPECNVPDCGNPIRSSRAEFCERHYWQVRRNGYLGPKIMPDPPRTLDHSGGYKLLYSPRHPIATKGQQSRVYEHRAVYYEYNGDGPFDCVHCGATVTWQTMHVDHLDDDPTNNEISNLGASCPVCNQARGIAKMRKAARRRSMQITWKGETKSVYDWAEALGFSPAMLKARIKAGWPLSRAMTEPRGVFGPKAHAA